MSIIQSLPMWAALPVALLVVVGSTLTMIGALGLLRLRSFYERLHTPSLGTSWGTGTIVFASMLYFSAGMDRIQVHELIIGIFIMVTTPATTMTLGRAALNRDRADGLIEGPAPLTIAVTPDQEPVAKTDPS